jgi:predicted anti-sigma-YlaC factor YlaD
MEKILSPNIAEDETRDGVHTHRPSLAESHLLECAECRSRFRATLPSPADLFLLVGKQTSESTCLQREERLNYLEGLCDDLERESIELHLAVCGSCRMKLRRQALRG